jgi:PAS domain S-box-containing protein
MLTSGVTLLLASLAFVVIDLIHLRKSLTAELSSQAEILAYNSTAALAFNDSKTAETILSALQYRQPIVTACIFDLDGKMFAVYHRDQLIEELTLPGSQESGYRFEDGHLHLYRSIVLDSDTLGTVYIRSDLSQIEATLRQFYFIGLFVLMIGTIVAYLLSTKLQRVISVPVIQLAKIARMISREKNYTVRAEKRSEDELGDLVEAFNEMLIQIQARDIELRSERDYSAGIITGTPAIICRISSDGTTTFVNPAAEKITGYSAEEHIGKNWWQMHYPGDEYKQVEKLFQDFERGDIRDYEMNLTTKSGDKRTILWNSINRYDENGKCIEIIGVGNDITERKRTEKELKKHRNHLEDLVTERTVELTRTNERLQREITERNQAEKALQESELKFRSVTQSAVNDAIISADSKGKIISWNKGAKTIFGYEEEEAFGKSLTFLMPERYRDAHQKGLKRFLSTGKSKVLGRTIEMNGLRKDDTEFPFEISLSTWEAGEEIFFSGILRDITERKLAERELHRITASLKEAQRVSHLGNWDWNIETNDLLWSDEIYRIFGLAPQQFGATYEAFLEVVHPDDRHHVEESVNDALNKDKSYNIDHRIVLSDGTERIVHETAEVTFDENGKPIRMVGTVQDITDRMRVEEELRESEERFRTSTRTAKDAIIIIDDQGKISYWNPEAENIFGYKREEAMGRELHPLIAPSRFLDAYRKGFTEFKKTGKGNVVGKTLELVGVRKEGIEFPIELSLSSFQIKDKWNAVGIARDITERKRVEEELKKTIQDLHRTNDELKTTQSQLAQTEKMASLGMLVAGIAHEINTPIGALSSMHDTLIRAIEKLTGELETVYRDDYRKNTQIMSTLKVIEDANKVIESGAERITTIVRRLRSFARLDESELVKADIHEGLDNTLALIHHQIKNKVKVTLKYGNVPLFSFYPSQINQVFLNILINAMQAIPDEGEIIITTFRSDNKVSIEISDSGIGISKTNLQKVFDPGFTTKGVGVGTGLGLSICYQIIKDHHGEIHVESDVGKGTTFKIILPANLDEILGISSSPDLRETGTLNS